MKTETATKERRVPMIPVASETIPFRPGRIAGRKIWNPGGIVTRYINHKFSNNSQKKKDK